MRSQRRDSPPPPPSLSLDRRMSKLAEKGDGERKHKSPRGKTYYARALRKNIFLQGRSIRYRSLASLVTRCTYALDAASSRSRAHDG